MAKDEPTPAERLAWLRLARCETVGPVTFAELIRRFGDPSRALAALPAMAERAGRAGGPRIPTPAQIQAELSAGEALGARLLCADEAAYPPLLAALDPPPPVIWAWGQLGLLTRPGVAIVGARIASAAGQRFARTLARDLGLAGQVVISGMARGIDAAAHEGALETGTVAVLGGGIDDIYPPEHRDLHARLVARGCVVSESPPGAQARAKDFPRRNRLISGLARAVVVVEAELRSGSLITARLAAEQGREVLAVPGSPLDPRAKGPNDLIRQGAALCEGAEDVMRALHGLGGLREPPAPAFTAGGGAPDAADARLIVQVAGLLSPTPTPRDELVRILGAPPSAVYAALVELAVAGRAELLAGGMVAAAE